MPNDKLANVSVQNYHKEYYKKNKELIRSKRLLLKANIVNEDVKQWKINKINNPWAFYPFHDLCSKQLFKVATNQEGSTPPNTDDSNTISSTSSSINSKDAL